MKRYLTDTWPEAEAVLIELLRQAPPWRKIRMMEQLNQQMRVLSLAGVRSRHPQADEAEVRRRAAEIWLGPELATNVYNSLTNGWPLSTNTMINYISPDAIHEAIVYHSSFNLIHLASLFKVDIFIPKARAFDTAQLAHGIGGSLTAESERQVRITSAEDTILVKLERYRLGNQSSDRQWQDIIGVLRVQSYRLDLDDMRRMARELGVVDLLKIALAETGSSSSPPNSAI